MLVVVAFIWYKVFFRVKENLFGDEQTVADNRLTPNFYQGSVEIDTFPIKLDYRDPFEDIKRGPSTVNPENSPTQNPARIKPIPQPTPWPAIHYYGMIRKTSSKEPLGIISIDGYKHTLRKGEFIYDGIKVISLDREGMKIRYKGEVRMFLRN